MHYNVGKVLTDAGLDEKGEAVYKEAIRYILHPYFTQWLLGFDCYCIYFADYIQSMTKL